MGANVGEAWPPLGPIPLLSFFPLHFTLAAWLPAEVPSMQAMHTSSRVPWMSLGSQETPASGEELMVSPQPWALEMEMEMEVEGGDEGLSEEGEGWV